MRILLLKHWFYSSAGTSCTISKHAGVLFNMEVLSGSCNGCIKVEGEGCPHSKDVVSPNSIPGSLPNHLKAEGSIPLAVSSWIQANNHARQRSTIDRIPTYPDFLAAPQVAHGASFWPDRTSSRNLPELELLC